MDDEKFSNMLRDLVGSSDDGPDEHPVYASDIGDITAGRVADILSIRLVACDAGRMEARFKVAVYPWMLNAYKILHGGVTGAICDRCMSALARSLGMPSTSDIDAMQLSYQRPVESGAELHVICRLVSRIGARYHVEALGVLDGTPAEKPRFTATASFGLLGGVALPDLAVNASPCDMAGASGRVPGFGERGGEGAAAAPDADDEDMRAFFNILVERGAKRLAPGFAFLIPKAIESCCFRTRESVTRFITTPSMGAVGDTLFSGCAAMVLDQAMGQLSYYCFGKREFTPTITLTLTHIRPAPIGPDLVVRAKVVSQGKHMLFLAAEMWSDGEAGSPVYTATGIYYGS